MSLISLKDQYIKILQQFRSPVLLINSLLVNIQCVCVCVCVCVYTGNLKKKKKCQSFLSLISESETHILYRFITHRAKYFKPLFIEMLMIMAYRQ